MSDSYRFKKDDPEYQQKRHKHLVELTKNRYKNDEVFRDKCKERARAHYQKLKTMANNNSMV
jgi:hypothetical protein